MCRKTTGKRLCRNTAESGSDNKPERNKEKIADKAELYEQRQRICTGNNKFKFPQAINHRRRKKAYLPCLFSHVMMAFLKKTRMTYLQIFLTFF